MTRHDRSVALVFGGIVGLAFVGLRTLSGPAVPSDIPGTGEPPLRSTAECATDEPRRDVARNDSCVKRVKRRLADVRRAHRGDSVPETTATALAAAADEISEEELSDVVGALGLAEARSAFGRRLFWRWANAHPAEAAEWAANLELGDLRRELCARAAGIWANRDAPAALEWVGRMPQGDAAEVMLSGIGFAVAEHAPPAALEVAMLMTEAAGARDALTGYALARWATDDARAAAGFVEALPPGVARDKLVANLATSWANIDGAIAVEYASLALRESDATLREQTLAVVACTWSESDPKAAMDWFACGEAGPFRNRMIAMLAENWAESDIRGLSEWLRTTADEQIRDCGAAGLVERLAMRNPTLARAWSETIADDRLRKSLLERLRRVEHEPSLP